MKQLTILFIFFSTFSWCSLTYAQTVTPKAQNRLEQFKAEKKAYLIKEIGLTPAEEKQFFPLYEELQSKKFQLNRKVRGEMKRIAHSTMPVSENEYAASAAAINDLPLQEALLEKEYFEKFKKILSPKKMFLYKRAETLFAKKLLKDHRPAR